MTPGEVLATAEAVSWDADLRQQMNTALAWQVAVLSRAKTIPSIKSLLSSRPARPLKGEELKKRRLEFEDMTSGVDLSKINETAKKLRRAK